jgi:hypothetical protein
MRVGLEEHVSEETTSCLAERTRELDRRGSE